MSLKQTPLYDQHIFLKAKMVPFGGWEMPVQYQGIIKEYQATRGKVAIFDICHMGEFLVHGDPAVTGLDHIVTQNIADMPVGACRYGLMLNDQGGVIDDLIVFRLEKQKYMLVVNAATAPKDAAHIQKHLTDPAVFQDISAQTGKIDVQGPTARDFLKPLVAGIEKLEYYTSDTFDVLGEQVIVSRTGYTGELGYEIYFPASKIAVLWDKLIAMGAVPAGLGARDVLRVEMGYPLYGHEITEDIIALDAGLNRFIDWEKDFVGKEALLDYKERGASRSLICFVSESRRSPREGQKIFDHNHVEVGVVSSGTFSPSLGCGVGLGFIGEGKIGDAIFFGTQEHEVSARISSRPIYKEGSLKT